MRAFEDLTPSGQARRVGTFARDVLLAYPVRTEGLRIRTAAHSFNTVLRVRASDGFDGALRVGPREHIHPEGIEDAEVAWMRSLTDDGVLRPPTVVDARDGRVAVHHAGASIPGRRVCVLFEWIRGRSLRDALTGEGAEELGRIAALLHQHASADRSPVAPTIPVADRVLYWGVPNQLRRAPAGAMLVEALDRTTRVLESLWFSPPSAPHVVHGDLTPANALVHRNGLTPIDFQDLVWGLDVQDLSISLASFNRFAGSDELRRRFRRGYISVRRWPDTSPEVMEALIAARLLHQLNLTLALGRPVDSEVVQRTTRALNDWMTTGRSDPAAGTR